MDLDNGIIPTTIEDGKKYCKTFTQAMLDRKIKFHKDKIPKNAFLFACLPRSGSNLVKYLLEEVTGFYICDPYPIVPVGEYLSERGVCYGTTTHCQMIKTHYPFQDFLIRSPLSHEIKKAIVLTRDPVSNCESHFHLVVTWNHDELAPPEIAKNNKKIYENFLLGENVEYKKFHEYWINETRLLKLFVRFEDYCEKPKETLETIFKFLEGTEKLRPEIQNKIIDLEKSNSFFKSPYKVTKNYSAKVDPYEAVPYQIILKMYHDNIDSLKKFKYVSLMKKRTHNKIQDDHEDNLTWISECNNKNIGASLQTKTPELKGFFLKNSGFDLSLVPVLYATFLHPNWWMESLDFSIRKKNLNIISLSIVYFFFFYYKHIIGLCMLIIIIKLWQQQSFERE